MVSRRYVRRAAFATHSLAVRAGSLRCSSLVQLDATYYCTRPCRCALCDLQQQFEQLHRFFAGVCCVRTSDENKTYL